MELFLLHHSEWERLYNCTGVEQQLAALYPPETRVFPLASWAVIILGAIYTVLYVPCMISIWKHLELACYKLLFYIGVTDMAVLWVIGFYQGYLGLSGAFFCTHPTTIYIAGAICLLIWIAESTADLILAINRCIETISPHTAETLFGGNRAWFWVGLSTVYALYCFTLTRTVIYIPMYFSWFFNPYTGLSADPDGIYENRVHSVHNLFLSVAYPLTYVFFLVAFAVKTHKYRMASSMSTTQKMIFLQVLIISCLNTMAGFIYAYMQYVSAPEWLIIVGQFAWFHIHGLPPVIYLALNKTIRQDCKMLLLRAFTAYKTTRIHGVTAVVTPHSALTTAAVAPGGQEMEMSQKEGTPNQLVNESVA